MAGFLSPATREQIRAASDIVDIIGSYVPLKKNGANFTALCPFHKEKSPSFNVNPHKQIFHCFGCHKGGDVFTFVKDYENIGFMDAVRRLAERAKIPLEFENTPGAQESRHLKDQLLEIHEQLTQRWQNCLTNEAAGQRARDYLASRGVTADAIKLFRIGAAPESWDDTVNWARSKKFDLETVATAGMIVGKPIDAAPSSASDAENPQSAIGNRQSAIRYYDRFRGRLMFPICDEQGRVVAFSGRVLPGDESPAKYVNSPETPIFTKSKIFFGLDKSKRAILDAGYAIICEGQLDLIACFMGGVQNIVAPQGTAFTEQHARTIKRYAGEVVLCFDSDLAGQKAAIRGLEGLMATDFSSTVDAISIALSKKGTTTSSLLSSGLAIRVAVLPAPHDPDSYIKNFGSDAFRKLIEKAESFFDFYLNHLCLIHDVKSDLGKSNVAKAMIEVLNKTGNLLLVDTYVQKTAMRLGISAGSVLGEFNKVARSPTNFTSKNNRDEVTERNTDLIETSAHPASHESHLLKLLFIHEDLTPWLAAHLDTNWILHPLVRQLVQARLDAAANGTWQNLAAFLDATDSAFARSLITEAVADEKPLPNPQVQLADVTLKLRNQFLDQQIFAFTQRAGQAETSDAEKNEALLTREKLRGQKRSPLATLEK
jgi:DNA primase